MLYSQHTKAHDFHHVSMKHTKPPQRHHHSEWGYMYLVRSKTGSLLWRPPVALARAAAVVVARARALIRLETYHIYRVVSPRGRCRDAWAAGSFS